MTAAADSTENLWYLCTVLINVFVASPDPDPNPRGGGQLPNPNECSSTLTSGTNNIYPYPYIDVNDRGHRFRSRSPLTNYPHAPPIRVYFLAFESETGCLFSSLTLKQGAKFVRSIRARAPIHSTVWHPLVGFNLFVFCSGN